MRPYRQAFRRHRTLLIAPIVVAAMIAGWFSFGEAPTYRSSAALWVDNGSSVASSLETAAISVDEAAQAEASSATGSPSAAPVAVGPAGFESQVLSELLSTPDFDVAVGDDSPLPRFLEAGGGAGGFSPTALLAARAAPAPAEADAEAAELVSTNTSATTAGPQVLLLTYTGASPTVTRSVLRSVIAQLRASALTFGIDIGRTAAQFYKHNLATATWAVANTRAALAMYVRHHGSSNAGNDPTYRGLASEVRLATAQLASVQASSSQAEIEAQGPGQGATMDVIDPPTLPDDPVNGLGSKLAGVLGGAFAGFVVSLLALIALTPRPPSRWDAEVPFFERLASRDRSGRDRRARPAGSSAVRPGDPGQGLQPQRDGAS